MNKKNSETQLQIPSCQPVNNTDTNKLQFITKLNLQRINTIKISWDPFDFLCLSKDGLFFILFYFF